MLVSWLLSLGTAAVATICRCIELTPFRRSHCECKFSYVSMQWTHTKLNLFHCLSSFFSLSLSVWLHYASECNAKPSDKRVKCSLYEISNLNAEKWKNAKISVDFFFLYPFCCWLTEKSTSTAFFALLSRSLSRYFSVATWTILHIGKNAHTKQQNWSWRSSV